MGARALLLVFAAGAWLSFAAPTATASSADGATTQAYVQANYALVSVAKSHLKQSEGEPLQVLAHVRGECPQAGAASPQNPESTEMSNEVIGSMVLSAALPDRQAIASFVRKVSGLRWRSGGLTRTIHAYAGKLQTLLSLSPPNLCADVRAWAATGFHSLPATTTSFVAKFMPAWVALGLVPAAMSSSESARTRALVGRAARVENDLTEAEARAVAHWGAIMNELVLWP
jgi:hypothetical protein